MVSYKIVAIKGDGIGPEIVEEAIKVLHKVAEVFNVQFDFEYHLMGGCALDAVGVSLPKETLDAALKSDAVLLGAVGGPKWDHMPNGDRPEKGLLAIRTGLQLFANLRPAILYPQLKDASPLKQEIVANGLDILIVRELVSGIYFGERQKVVCEENEDETFASDLEKYTVGEIKRIVKVGFEAAMKRNKKVCVVDKANVLESSRLWRQVVNEVASNYKEVEYSFMYVDNAAMQLVVNPSQFDVIITSNIFGDILSDEASVITGSIGMLSSASLGSTSLGLYEPSHGSAPDIAGQNKANPLATILSAAMMLRYSLGLEEAAKSIEKAVNDVLDEGYRTVDIMSEGMKQVGTIEMGDLVASKIAL